MWRKFHSKIVRLLDSITTKIILIMVLFILPLNTLVIISTIHELRLIQEQAKVSMENAANLFTQELDNRIFSINYFFYELKEYDTDFAILTKQQGDDEYVLSKAQISKKLKNNIEATASADGYFLYSHNLGDFFITTSTRLSIADNTNIRAIQKGLQDWLFVTDLSNLERWSLIEANEGKWLLRILEIDNFYYGALVSLDNLSQEARESIDFQQMQINMDVNSNIAVKSEALKAISHSNRIDFNISISVPVKEIIMSLPLLKWIEIALAFLSILLAPLLFLILNRILLRPMGKIRNALLHIKENERDYRINAHNYSEEFRVIYQSFNEMADNIELLRIENYEKEMSRQKMELRNLQLQIRPHFLLNMFKLVYGLAQVQDYQGIQKLTLYLSNYFRYIFRSGKDLEPFDKEYSLVQEYLEISMIRYPNRFSVQYEIEESVSCVELPPLLLHNFVENVINHALLPNETVHIVISAHYADGWVELIISDDGAGMEPDLVKYINNGNIASYDDEHVHLGILNSYQRIRYFYGEQSKIHVVSAPGKGANVVIRFPYEVKEEFPS